MYSSHNQQQQPSRSYGGLVKETAVTHPSLHIRDVHDAHVVLEAVRLNILPLLKRRLLASERDELRSGHVYVWEEAQDDGGLLRWTDGRRWSQSRMRGDYLFYEEKIETTQEERDAKAARRARRASDPNAVVPPPIRRKDRPAKPNGLTKQTYSVTVHIPGEAEPRKWHVVAYFSADDYSRLPVVEHYPYLRSIRPPNGIFFSNKVLPTRNDRFSTSSSASPNTYSHSGSYSDESETHDDAYSPTSASAYPYHASSRPRHTDEPPSPVSMFSSPPSSPVSPYPPRLSAHEKPYATAHSHSHSHSHSTSLHPPSSYSHPLPLSSTQSQKHVGKIQLPPISSLGSYEKRPPLGPHSYSMPLHTGIGPQGHYAPLSDEDKRALNKFKVIL